MTTQPDPADGSLVEREGVNAGSDRSTAEGSGPVASAESALTAGSTTGLPADRPGQQADGQQGPDTTPSQAWSQDSGMATEGAHDPESGQDTGSMS